MCVVPARGLQRTFHKRRMFRTSEEIVQDASRHEHVLHVSHRQDQKVGRCVHDTNMFTHTLDRHDFALPSAEAERAIQCAFKSVRSHGVFAKDAFLKEKKKCLWGLIFKFRWWLLMVLACRRYNPRVVWGVHGRGLGWQSREDRSQFVFRSGHFRLSPVSVEK